VNRRNFAASLGISAALRILSPKSDFGRQSGKRDQSDEESSSNPVWSRPTIVPVPETTPGVTTPVRSLNGTWKFTLDPPERFWSDDVDASDWSNIEVPGECTMQGFGIARDTEYPFRRTVFIPADFVGKKMFLRFDGVYSYARVWVDGQYVRDHHGGFTSWDCDITRWAVPGKESQITVGITDESDNISWQSNYAKHYIGGILRDVRLFAVPADYVNRFHVRTDFDSSFTDAVLCVTLEMAFERSRRARIELSLKNPEGDHVSIRPGSVDLSHQRPEATITIPVVRPAKWDSEHPHLYTLEATVKVNDLPAQTLSKRFGFRKVAVHGNRLFLNGDAVKLHGGCRHDVYPTRGRSTTPGLDEEDVRLLKGANFNFVRTSHYPPTESFLDFCDRQGLYIEEESAVCFVDEAFGSRVAAQDDPHYTAQFMNQFSEMIERDRDHPSVIIWSLGNESQWGSNFAKEYSYVKREDPSRPVIFSFPESVPQGVKAYDIFSKHYPTFNSDYSSASIPRLNDEFGHVSCYNQVTLRRDPGVRNYWGRSIKEFWQGMAAASGCLGGSIWASIDEVFMLPSSSVGYGEWGIIDGWRRPKPEYWLAQKAYSPAKLPDEYVKSPGSGNPLKIPIRNEFNHTNLSEITIQWSVGSERGEIGNLDVPPHASGWLALPGRAWRNGEKVHIRLIGPTHQLVDEYEIRVGRAQWIFPPAGGPAPKVVEDSRTIRVSGPSFEIVLSKASGLIRHAAYEGHTVLEGGPVLNLAPATLQNWWLSSLKAATRDDEAVIEISGNYQREGNFADQVLVNVEYQVRIDGRGLITTDFKLDGIPPGTGEVGVAYILPSETDQLSWSRKSLWSAYPPDHIGRAAGIANKVRLGGREAYRAQPSWPWSQDTRDFFLFGKNDAGGRGTNDFRSQKENIWFASGIVSRTGVRARVESEARHAVRAEVQATGQVRLNVNTAWAYPELDWGNDCPALPVSSVYHGSVRLRLTDRDPIQAG
jgi:hypothetical protein